MMPATADKQNTSRSSFRERTELILGQLDRLPTLPAVIARLISLTTSADSTIDEVVTLIHSDPPLTAGILRMARRADLGIRAESMTVDRAVKALGLNAVRNAALSSRIHETLNRPGDNEQAAQFRRELWKHALAVACVADSLASSIKLGDIGRQAFVCGLLHDVGKMALDAALPKSYARVVQRTDRRRLCICDVEQELLGIDHVVAGRHLATRWQLPKAISECIWLHHQNPADLPKSVTNSQLVGLIHLADNLVRRQHIGYSGYQHLCDVEAAAAALGIDNTEIQRVVESLPQQMEPLCQLIGLEDTIGRTLYVQSLTKANIELLSLNEQLSEANRQLKSRSACLDAVQEFTERLSEHGRIGDVCAAAASSVCKLFQADSALVFVADALGPHLHVSACEQGADAKTTVNRLDDARNCDILRAVSSHGKCGELVPAPPGCDAIWQRFMQSVIPESLWVLPFVNTADLNCAALLAGGPEARAPGNPTRPWCGPLSSTVALAIATAKARTQAEQLNDEAFEANRRTRETQHGLVRERTVSMIAQMAAGAAHELNNPLSVIRGRAQMQLAVCDEPELARPLEVIVEQADIASQILAELMAFAKPEPPKPALRRVVELLESHFQDWCARSGVRPDRVALNIADDKATVFVDEQQFHKALEAILTNAVEACPPDSIQLQINSVSRSSDETILINVKDNGPGMPPELIEHAIDPFFSSRPAGRGRGLGLSRAYRFAEINGGRLWLDSTPNVGTTVTIELPARPPLA